MPKPTQSTEIRYKIAGSNMRRKCAYAKVNRDARAMMVANADGADADEFDEGTALQITVGGETFQCEAGPVFHVPEALVSVQVFSIKQQG